MVIQPIGNPSSSNTIQLIKCHIKFWYTIVQYSPSPLIQLLCQKKAVTLVRQYLFLTNPYWFLVKIFLYKCLPITFIQVSDLAWDYETLLAVLLDDLWQEQGWCSASILSLLYLLAAFNTVGYNILLDQLQGLGMDSTVLFFFLPLWLVPVVLIRSERSTLSPVLWGYAEFSSPI